MPMKKVTSKLAAAAAIGGCLVGGGAIANAATAGSGSSSSSAAARSAAPSGGMSPARHTFNGRAETALTGPTAAKVRAAALAKVAGTVERVETNVDDSVPYEAHIRKSDGTEVTVEVNTDFTAASVQTMGH